MFKQGSLIKKNNNKVDSINAGRIVIPHLHHTFLIKNN